MYKIVRNVVQRGNKRLYSPTNLEPRFEYNDVPEPNMRRLINNKLYTTEKIGTVINGKTYIGEDEKFRQFHHVSPLDKSAICYRAYGLQDDTLKNHLNSEEFERARLHWNNIGLEKRIEIFENIANQIESNVNGWKDGLLINTIVGQGKSLYEAEIDAICELVDFLKFNNSYAEEIMNRQYISTDDELNYSEINGLNGFVASITPFNFTAIGANLVSAPLLMGTPVVWKPSEYSLLSNYLYYNILLENNIPPEIVSFTPMHPEVFMGVVSEQRNLAGVAFTGSSQVFSQIYDMIGQNVGTGTYANYPRIVGETGGKNFHFVHPSADAEYVAEKTFHAAFGYSGQKCSACSRLYIPKPLWKNFCSKMLELLNELEDTGYHKNSLIHQTSYNKTTITLNQIEKDNRLDIIIGGKCSDIDNFYVSPTMVMSDELGHDIFHKEFFAPILAVYIYDPEKINETFDYCINGGGGYALTGAIFATDNYFIKKCYDDMRFKAGNFYINDKCTGSVVGRQPFGGMGISGTNDKAGDIGFLYRFMNQRSVKQALV